jgi:DNA-binding LacI/PurR family transcriptional regulator
LITNINPGQSKAPNMRDVAAAADVSISTVSLVVNGKPGVSQYRRERVLKVIKELGYIVDGHQKVGTETKVFGLLMESLSEASRS